MASVGQRDELLVLAGVRVLPAEGSTLYPEFPAPGIADPPAPDTVIEGSPQGTGVIPFPRTSGPGSFKSMAVIIVYSPAPTPISEHSPSSPMNGE